MKKDSKSGKRSSSNVRRGVMLPMIALLLPVLIVFLGFAVDLAYMQNTRLELRAVTDAAARAAAAELSKTDSKREARKAAKRIAKANRVAGKPLKLKNRDIEIGRSIRDASGRWSFSKGAKPANSVRVTGARTGGSASGPVSLFFGRQIGAANFEPMTTSTASFLNIDICLVLDRSTSMKVDVNSDEKGLYTSDPRFCRPPTSTSRWNALHDAVQVFTDTLRGTRAIELVALSTYSSSFTPASFCGTSGTPATLNLSLTGNMATVDEEIDNISDEVWNGNTNIESGMRIAMDTLQNDVLARQGADKVMIVLTDGNENEGNALGAANDCRSAEIRVNTVTFSVDANQLLMKEVAKAGGGRHLHANTTTELKEAFRELAAQAAQLTD